MNVLLLSNSDIEGGAARAAYRLHQGFQEVEVSSQMFVQVKQSSDSNVLGSRSTSGIIKIINSSRLILDQAPLKLYSKRDKEATFSPQWLPDSITSKITRTNPDIINLHWVNGGYLKVESVPKLPQPIVWTLHDMWAFTGGCHYDQECGRYADNCGQCPQLASQADQDLSRWIWHRKVKAWKKLNLTIVCPSRWLANCARDSSLLKESRIEVIPYGLDTTKYRPIDPITARSLLNLPQDKQLILFGALQATGDRRKGFHLLQTALQELAKRDGFDQVELVVFGSSKPSKPPDFSFRTHYLDTLSDDISLALAYSAADVFVAPSTQDNLPNTVLEALACAVPCVAFNIGGMPDMIDHEQNGYLAKPYKAEDLAQGIAWVLNNQERHQKLSYHARKKVEQEFPLALQAQRYKALFSEILGHSPQ